MALIIKLKGQTDTDEYKAAQELRKLFEGNVFNEVEGNVTIISNVTLFGQEIKDVDLVVFGKIGKGFKRRLKFRPKGEENYENSNVYFSNFCFTIELKKHSVQDIQIGNMNNVLVTYNNKKHDVTYQSEKQKYSLKRYLKNIDDVRADVYVINFIWLKNMTSKDLLLLTNKGEHNILPKEFSIDWLLMLLLSN